MIYEYNLGAKYLELLKEIAPGVTRVAIIRNAANPGGNAMFGALQNAARSLGVETSPVNVRDAREIERSVEAFARLPNGGLVVTQTANFYRDLTIALAARHKLPAVYGLRYGCCSAPTRSTAAASSRLSRSPRVTRCRPCITGVSLPTPVVWRAMERA
jgi:hypothetical protein